MKELFLKRMKLENFKNHKALDINFKMRSAIKGPNFAGKSSIADAFFWVLFGKSSTGKPEGKEFRVRPYDREGVDIDHIDVKAEITLGMNEQEIVLRKEQRQAWVKKRGTTEQVHTGDKNYYFWNEVEITETEFKARVNALIDEETLALVTDPTAFMRKKPADRRELLLAMVAGLTDEDIVAKLDGFGNLKLLIKTGKTVEEIAAIARKAITSGKDQKDRLASAIDERSRDIREVENLDDLTNQKAIVEAKIAEQKALRADAEKAVKALTEAYKAYGDAKTALSNYEYEKTSSVREARAAMQRRITDIELDASKANQGLTVIDAKISGNEERTAYLKEQMERAKRDYLDAKSAVVKAYEPLPTLSEKDFTCPTCGQLLPEDKRQELLFDHDVLEQKNRAKYDSEVAEIARRSAEKAKFAVDQGNKLKKDIEALAADKEKLIAEKDACEKHIEALVMQKTELVNQLKALPSEVDFTADAEHNKLVKKVADAEKTYSDLSAKGNPVDSIDYVLEKLANDLTDINLSLRQLEVNAEAERRINDLKTELLMTEQTIADQERIQMEIDEFNISKDDFLTEEVNKHFQNVRFQLYRMQKNGGKERTCDVYVKSGSPYGDNTTSTAEKLIAGLEIIKVLSEIVGVKAPIFIDNAESINDENIPQIDSQMILLSVKDCKGLEAN